MLLSLALLLAIQTAAPQPVAISQAELVRRTQQMMDAVTAGDPGPWKQYIADDAMVFDEKGNDMDKKAVLAGLQPLPTGYSGNIRVTHPKSLHTATTAILSYDMDETETVFGQELHARYHQTDTWLYRNRAWQIAASETMRYYEDPAVGAMPAHLDDYLGKYQIAPGNTLTVTREGDKLFAQRNGGKPAAAGKPAQLLPETCDLFFRAGVEGRRLFHRDASGHVDSLIDRRNNEDLVWKKIADAKE
jgi:hypothetical protein